MKIDASKTYRARDGREVTQLVVFDAKDREYPVFAVLDGVVRAWRLDGIYGTYGEQDCPRDLFECKPRIKGYMNIYERRVYKSTEDASRNSGRGRIACLHLDFEEGEGL